MFLFRFITKPLGCLTTLLGSFVLLILLFVVALFWLSGWALPKFGEQFINATTGFTARIDDANIGVITPGVALEDILIENPLEFADADFLRIRELSATAPYNALEGEVLLLKEVVLDIEQLNYVLTADGNNFEAFTESLGNYRLAQLGLGSSNEAKTEKAQPFSIDAVTVRLGTLSYHDMSRGQSTLKKVQLDYDRTFQNVVGWETVIEQVERDLSTQGFGVIAAHLLSQIRQATEPESWHQDSPTLTEALKKRLEDKLAGTESELKKFFESLKE